MTSASTKRRASVATLQHRSVAAKDAEIQRLRAAMVHAVDECEQAMKEGRMHSRALTMVAAAHTVLKTALAKK